MRESTLDIGDRVLIRNVGLKGKHKLADKWARHPNIVVGQPDNNIPVYKVRKESGKGQEKTLHRNMLLPFSIIPLTSELDDSLLSDRNVSQAPKRRKADKVSDFDTSSEESSESEAASLVPIHIPRHHNRDQQGRTH